MTRAPALAILALAATALPAAERPDDARWICVPTEDWGWRCGRGANAPEPAPLPPPQPRTRPPEGYTRPDQAGRIPHYLLDPTLPRPNAETPSDAAPDEAAASTAGSGEATTTPEEAPATTRPEAAAEPDTEPARTADVATSPDPVPAGDARYAIQLAAARDPESLSAYRRELELAQLDVYQRTWEDAGGTWHVLLTGRFATASTASRAMAALPERVRNHGAWVRPLGNLQTDPREP